MNLSAIALLLLFCLQNASGQKSEVIVADRPGFSTGTYTVALLWDYSPLYGFSPFGAFQFSSFISDGTRIHEFAPALGLSYSLSDRLSGFAEYFSQIPHKGATSHSIDGGVVYLLTNDVQLDIHAGMGLNPVVNDFAGFGIAVRL